MHFCPVPENAPFIAAATATSRSASSITARAFFEPISICSLVRFGIAAAAIPLPTCTEPVKLIASIPRTRRGAGPPRPEPITRLNSPGGRSCPATISASATAEAGTRLAGFQITALPKASAGAIFQTAVAIGKFHGLITATTPTGSRRMSTSMPGRTLSAFSPIWRRHSAA